MDVIRKSDGFERRAERSSPKLIDPKQGSNPATRVELAGVAVGMVVLVIGGFVVANKVLDIFRSESEIELVADSVMVTSVPAEGELCTWALSFELQNNTTEPIMLVRAIVDPRPTGPTPDATGMDELLISQRSSRIVYERPCGDLPDNLADIDLKVRFRRENGTMRTVQLDLDS